MHGSGADVCANGTRGVSLHSATDRPRWRPGGHGHARDEGIQSHTTPDDAAPGREVGRAERVSDPAAIHALVSAAYRFFGGPLLLALVVATVAILSYASWRKRQPPR